MSAKTSNTKVYTKSLKPLGLNHAMTPSLTALLVKVDVIYCRFSSELQSKASNVDQERRCREFLDRLGISHAQFRVICDEAISGEKDDRPGWNEVRELIRSGRLGTLVVTEQSRASRGDNVKGLIKDIYFQGGRFLSVTEGIDTDCDGWETLVGISELHHSRSNRDTANRVRGGQEGRVLDANGSAGDYPYGYASTFVDPVAAAAYSGRGGKPKKCVVIHEPAADVVRQIFSRFTAGESITAITRWLNSNRSSIPPIGNRSGKGTWHHQYVRRILANAKYVGVWTYGATTTVSDSTGRSKQVPARLNQRVTTVPRPSLRLVDQATWELAQAKLAKLKEIYGQRPDGKRRGPSQHYRLLYAKKPLNGLVVCGVCGSTMIHCGGKRGPSLGCLSHRNGDCSNSTNVPLAKAEQAVLQVVIGVLENLPQWLSTVVNEMEVEIQCQLAKVPDERATLGRQVQELDNQIQNLLDLVAGGTSSSPALSERLTQWEVQKATLMDRHRELSQLPATPEAVPTAAWVRQQLQDLAKLLRSGPLARSVTWWGR